MSLDAVAALLIVLAICDWLLTAVIFVAARQYPEPALVERAVTSIILSLIATFAAVLGAGRLGFIHVDNGVAVLILAVSLVLVSAPQFVWGLGLLLGKFR